METAWIVREDSAYSSAQVHYGSAMDGGFYRESRREEIEILVDLCCFQVTSWKEVEEHRLYRARFVYRVRPDSNRRSRLCVAAFDDRFHGLFTRTPTNCQISIRLVLCVAALERFTSDIRDTSKAFVMSRTPLCRPISMQPPLKIGLGKRKYVLKPVYGRPESRMHWFKTYSDYRKHTLSKSQTTLEPFLLLRRNENDLELLVGI